MVSRSGYHVFNKLMPISGDLSNFGAENNVAHQIAIDDFNAYLAEKGATWSLSLTTEDSQTLPTVALEKMQALHARGIQHVIGPESSGSLQNVKGYVDSNNMLVISCCSTSPLLAIEGDSIFRTVPDDTNQAVAIAKLLESNGIEVVIPVWREDAWGVGLKDALHEAFPALGGTVVEGFGYNPEASDFSTETSILADIVQGLVDENGTENVGVVYIAFGEAVLFFQSAQNHEVLNEIRWFGADASAKDPRFLSDPLALEFSTNTSFTTVIVASGQNDISAHVDESVAATLGNTPTAYASASYDAIWLLGLAMEATDSTDVDTLTEAIPLVADEHRGALGLVSLNSAGDLAQANYDIWAIEDEEWAFLGTYDAGSNSIVTDSVMLEQTLSGTIDIGLLLPISGDASNHGEENREAAKLAIIDFNQYLADNGAEWSLVMTIEDSQTQPAVALEKVQALHAKGINVMVGPYSSGNLQNIKGYVDNNAMVVVSCCSTSPLLAIEGDRIFRMSPDDTNQGVVLARLMADAGIEVVIPVWREDAWGSELAKSARAAFTNIGGEVTEGLGYNPEISEFSVSAALVSDQVQSAVDQTGSTDNVGVLFMGFGEIELFMQSASNYEILPQIQWFGADPHSRDPALVEDPIASQFVADTEFSAVQVASGKNKFSDRVVAGVNDELGREPSTYASSTYDAVWLVGLAIENTQGTDVDAITAEIPIIANKHIGALGSTELNAAGDLAQTNYDIWHIVDNQWILRGVYFSATDSIALEDDVMKEKPVEPDEPEPPGGCLIATAAYGSELAPQVQFLREIRDNALLSTESGTSFMTGFNQVYYSFSPAIADLERENPIFRDAVRALITPGLYTMNIMTLADPGSEASVLVFGMLSIAAIGGVYVAGPVLAVHTVRKRISRRS